MDHLSRDDEIRGADLSIAAIKNFRNPTWSLNTRMYPDAVGFALTSILGLPTTTAGNGVITDPDSATIPAGAYRHVWTGAFANGISAVNPPTLDMDIGYVDQSTFFKIRGAAVNTLGIENPDDDASSLTLEGPACYLNRQADPSLTATLESASAPLFSRANLSIPTWLTGTGTNQNISLTITRNVESVRTMGVATDGWPDTTEWTNDPISTSITASIEKRQLDDDDITALIAATGFAAKVKWTTGTNYITGTTPYALWCQFTNAQYMEGTPEELGNKRRHGATYEVRSSSADGTTAPTTITLVNSITSYT